MGLLLLPVEVVSPLTGLNSTKRRNSGVHRIQSKTDPIGFGAIILILDRIGSDWIGKVVPAVGSDHNSQKITKTIVKVLFLFIFTFLILCY